MNHRAPIQPERTEEFPLIVRLRDDDRAEPVIHRARRDVDGSYRLRLVPRQRYRRDDLDVLDIAPEPGSGHAGMGALLTLFAVLALVVVVGVGAAWVLR